MIINMRFLNALIIIGISINCVADPNHCKNIPTELKATLNAYDEMLEQYKSLMAEEKFRINVSERESASEGLDTPKTTSSEISSLSYQMKKHGLII